ncbi:MAG: NADH dehydrogenase ubiquinone Fe-S protein 4 [Parvibaculales bacterium]
MEARIYKPVKNAMQSGQAEKPWVLRFLPRRDKSCMEDMLRQLEICFASCEAAEQYAKEHNIPYRVEKEYRVRRKPKLYSDNFRSDRKEQWTH